MLKIMDDPNEPKDFRARMAQAAVPFVLARADAKGGKKAEKEEAAKEAGTGRFAPSPGQKAVPI